MNSLLLKHAPKDIDKDTFEKMWENSSYTLEALFKVIVELAPAPKIGKEDFALPAFTEKLVYDQARHDLGKTILSMFPKKLLDKP